MKKDKPDLDLTGVFFGNPDLREIPDGVVHNSAGGHSDAYVKLDDAFNRNRPITANDIGFVKINDPVQIKDVDGEPSESVAVSIERALRNRTTLTFGDIQLFAKENPTGNSAVEVIPRASKTGVGLVSIGSGIDVTPEGVISVGLKPATSTSLGLVKAGNNITIDEDGTIHGTSSYTHPATHPASMITCDSTHRFVTDDQINNWNSKVSGSGTYTDMTVGKAKQLETARTFRLSGDASGSGSFNGTGDCDINVSISKLDGYLKLGSFIPSTDVGESNNGCYTVKGAMSDVSGVNDTLFNLISYGEESMTNSQVLFPASLNELSGSNNERTSEMYFRTANTSGWRKGGWCRVWHSNNFDPTTITNKISSVEGSVSAVSNRVTATESKISEIDNINKVVTFEVGGDADKYYPVYIDSYKGVGILNIYRNYYEKAPNSWFDNSSTHHGALNLSLFMRIGGTHWDGDPTELLCLRWDETYTTIAAKVVLDIRGLYVWLRGGGAVYHLNTSLKDTSKNLQATVLLNGIKYKDLGGSYAQYHPDLAYYPGTYSECGSAESIKNIKVIRRYELSDYWNISKDSRFGDSGKGLVNGNSSVWIGWNNELNFSSSSDYYYLNYRNINGPSIKTFSFGDGSGADGSRNGKIQCGILESKNVVSLDDVVSSSDARLKENVNTLSNSLEVIKHLRGVSFTRNDLEDKEKLHIGLIAQEVKEVVPELVDTVDKEKGLLGVKYDKIVAYLIEAVKEQQKMIENLLKK